VHRACTQNDRPLLIIGIVILVASLIVERAATIRSGQLVNAAGGDWNTKDVRYASEGGPPKWLSAVSLLAYVGIVVGVGLIIMSFL
jgi:hypothetical protein